MNELFDDLREHVRELEAEASYTDAEAPWHIVWMDIRKAILKVIRGEISYQEYVEGIAWALGIDLPDKTL
jgi:hypothetical protein